MDIWGIPLYGGYYTRLLLRSEITPCYETPYAGGGPRPPEASNVRGIDDIVRCADADDAEVAAP